MDRETIRRLELLNQLSLTEEQKDDVISFFDKKEEEFKVIEKLDTSDTERMVHVMPIMTVIREDKVIQSFSREELQNGAPDTDEGYWCVPKVLE